MKRFAVVFILTFFVSSTALAAGGNIEDRIKRLEGLIEGHEEIIKKQEATIKRLEEKFKGDKVVRQRIADKRLLSEEDKISIVDRVIASASKRVPGNKTGNTRSSMNPAISLTMDTFYYSTNFSDAELDAREIPGYRILNEEAGSAQKEGFNLRSAELAISAPVDPYLKLYTKIPISETGLEVEEAFFITTALPRGLQLKGGKFKSGFGRFNAFHQHAWNFVDAPLPYLAFFGKEGLVEKGMQVTYMPVLPIYTLLGLELLQGSNEVLFGDDAEDGAHAYVAFAKVSKDFGTRSTVLAGVSVAGGDTKTGSIARDSEFKADSTIYGAELTYKWRPSKNRGFMLQTEYLLRRQAGKYIADVTVPSGVERLTRSQDGLYVQGFYQFGRWRAGARYDVLDVFEDDFIKAGTAQDFGQSPERMTGSLEFNPTEFTRLRLQYNHDEMARSGKTNHELYLQLILGIGAHGAHSF